MAEPEIVQAEKNQEDSAAEAVDAVTVQPAAELTTEIAPASTAKPLKSRVRTDKGRLHAVRHGVLARYPLEALRRLGEDGKALRRLERRFREELKPGGVLGEMFFDKFWSSFLRCLLAARTEANAFVPRAQSQHGQTATSTIVGEELPILVVSEKQGLGAAGESLPPDVLRELALVQRYDAHFGKEAYKALALLLILRRNGTSGLGQAMATAFGLEG